MIEYIQTSSGLNAHNIKESCIQSTKYDVDSEKRRLVMIGVESVSLLRIVLQKIVLK